MGSSENTVSPLEGLSRGYAFFGGMLRGLLRGYASGSASHELHHMELTSYLRL